MAWAGRGGWRVTVGWLVVNVGRLWVTSCGFLTSWKSFKTQSRCVYHTMGVCGGVNEVEQALVAGITASKSIHHARRCWNQIVKLCVEAKLRKKFMLACACSLCTVPWYIAWARNKSLQKTVSMRCVSGLKYACIGPWDVCGVRFFFFPSRFCVHVSLCRYICNHRVLVVLRGHMLYMHMHACICVCVSVMRVHVHATLHECLRMHACMHAYVHTRTVQVGLT